MNDEALFEQIEFRKKKKKKKILATIILIVVFLSVAAVFGILWLKKSVSRKFGGNGEEVLCAEATIGSISTTVSGSGRLVNEDEEQITLPAGVIIEEILPAVNEQFAEGDVIATVDLTSVLTSMSSLQEEIDSLNSDINDAQYDTVSSIITAGVSGRLKKLYAGQGDSVSQVMYDCGALALLSVDGYMYLEIDAGELHTGDAVTVIRDNEKQTEVTGKVGSVTAGKAEILIKDDKVSYEELLQVKDSDGRVLGESQALIHSQIRITGIQGTISWVGTAENTYVYSSSSIYGLTDTSYKGNYNDLVDTRSEKETDLAQLVQIYQNGAVLAPWSGSVSSIDYDESTWDKTLETALVTLSPDRQVSVTINVDESDILSLELGQKAFVTVSSVGDESYQGEVTKINRTATSASGVTRYTATVTLDKEEKMIPGMSSSVVINIRGIDQAIIIPVEALHQTSSSSYVYTSYDEEMHTFGDPVEVTVGIQNSEYAEITDGLMEGDSVYYTAQETFAFGQAMFEGGGFGDSNRPEMSGDGRPNGNGFNNNFGGNPGGNPGGMPGGNGGARP